MTTDDTTRAPLVRLAAPHVDEAGIAEVIELLRSGMLAGGAQVALLESEFSEIVGHAPTAAVSNGTTSLFLAGRALGLGPGDTVLVPAFTFAATANAFLALSCRVVPVDVSSETMNMDADDLARAIAEHPDSRAVVVVDLYGSTAGTDACFAVANEAGLLTVEDAAQAHGATCTGGSPLGRRAHGTSYSFYATKNVAAGEGGLVASPSQQLIDRVALLRNHGTSDACHFSEVSLNYRMTDLAALLARLSLLQLDEGNARRRSHARVLAGAFLDAWGDRVALPRVPDDGTHVVHQFTVRFATETLRDRARATFDEARIETKVFYPYTTSDLPGVDSRPVPVASSLARTVLSIPVHPRLEQGELELIVDAVRSGAELAAASPSS